MISLDDVRAAAGRLRDRIHRTPVITCRSFDEATRYSVFFKCENLQRAGSFKIRGALNKLLTLSESERATFTRLSNRRAGIEPLIGHAKQGGQLGHSRRKSDETTLAAGYAAIGGFNLRQLSRHQLGKKIKPMT